MLSLFYKLKKCKIRKNKLCVTGPLIIINIKFYDSLSFEITQNSQCTYNFSRWSRWFDNKCVNGNNFSCTDHFPLRAINEVTYARNERHRAIRVLLADVLACQHANGVCLALGTIPEYRVKL